MNNELSAKLSANDADFLFFFSLGICSIRRSNYSIFWLSIWSHNSFEYAGKKMYSFTKKRQMYLKSKQHPNDSTVLLNWLTT